MTPMETAWAYLVRDEVCHANPLEVLRRGSGEVLAAGPDGVLIYDRGSRGHMMSAQTMEAAERMLPLVPKTCDLFTGHQLFYRDRAVACLGLKDGHLCYSALYTGKEPLPIPDFGGELRPLTPEFAPFVEQHYSASFGGVAYILGAIERGMIGAFLDGVLAGFVGFHEEGSIGMLEVLPPYRRRGLGEILERAAIDLALERGQYPFGQIIDGNEASLALQQKVGMTIAEEKMFWLF